MKAYLTKQGYAVLELTFNELTEIKMCLSAYVRGAGAVNQLAIDMDARLGKMWDYWMNGPTTGQPDHRAGGCPVVVGKPPANQTGQRTQDQSNPARLKTEPVPPSTERQS